MNTSFLKPLEKVPPLGTALLVACAIPVAALLLALASVLLLCAWPALPFLAYSLDKRGQAESPVPDQPKGRKP